VLIAGCNSDHASSVDASAGGDSAAPADAAVQLDAPASSAGLGTVTNVTDVTCPTGSPPSSTCKQVTVGGCSGLAAEPLVATLAIQAPATTSMGTVVHFKGGGG